MNSCCKCFCGRDGIWTFGIVHLHHHKVVLRDDPTVLEGICYCIWNQTYYWWLYVPLHTCERSSSKSWGWRWFCVLLHFIPTGTRSWQQSLMWSTLQEVRKAAWCQFIFLQSSQGLYTSMCWVFVSVSYSFLVWQQLREFSTKVSCETGVSETQISFLNCGCCCVPGATQNTIRVAQVNWALVFRVCILT